MDALVSAYNHQKFIEMLRLRMGVNLEDIATGDSYREIVFKTVRHYADQSPAALWHMVVQAALGNPGNEKMAALVEKLPQATQSPRWVVEGEAHRMLKSNSVYGEVETVVNELVKQVSRLENAFTRLETSAQYIAEASDKRVAAVEKEIEVINAWRAAMQKELELSRERANEPRGLAMTRRQGILLFAGLLLIPILTGVVVYMAQVLAG